jgi:putative N6-adenine-specific DNA methylase
MRIDEFTARSYPELYNKLRRINWEVYTGFSSSVTFCVSSLRSRLHHTDRIAETAFSALCDHVRPLDVAIETDKNATIRFFIRFLDDKCTISIDSSGSLLYKRGYRQATGRAPLRETTAATLLAAVQWEKYEVIADPCCGTGSIIIEALQRIQQVPPGAARDFAFFSWPSFSKPAWEHLKTRNLVAAAVSVKPHLVYAGDIDPATLDQLKTNCAPFSANERVKIMHADCRTFNKNSEFGHRGLIISNLPYGKRISVEDSDIDEFYGSLGSSLKRYCRGWNFAFLVADPHFERKARLKGDTILEFMNGGIRVRFIMGSIS